MLVWGNEDRRMHELVTNRSSPSPTELRAPVSRTDDNRVTAKPRVCFR